MNSESKPYKVLLVDDERIIREGISALVDWAGLGLELAGCMTDGQAVLEELDGIQPDIVITDIKMPRVDGLELIQLAQDKQPGIKFVVLSGFGEFRFASKAMQFGVKHYLLKPCDEDDIKKVLEEVVKELDAERLERQRYGQMESMLSEAMTKAQEKWLSDFLLGQLREADMAETSDTADTDAASVQNRLQIGEEAIRLLLCRTDKEPRYDDVHKLAALLDASLGEEVIKHAVVIDHLIVFLITAVHPPSELAESVKQIARSCEKTGEWRLHWSMSDAGIFKELPDIYKEAKRHMAQLCFLGESTDVDLEVDVRAEAANRAELVKDVVELVRSAGIIANIQLGLKENLNRELAAFFAALRRRRLPIGTTKGACIDLAITMYKQCIPQQSHEYLEQTGPILEMETLEEVERYIYAEAASILETYYGNPAARGGMTAHRIAQLVHDHLDQEELSLQWLAKHKLFMNPDYLGKLFRKELHMPFPQYVAKARIDKAKEMLERSGNVKIYELAERLGMGSDPKYFSNLFKKYTGCTPQEYKTRIVAERGKEQ
ncbi:response regulator [Paenibacillus sp. NPDC058071]|uniref:response regulator n=1 Tax=Paenibacillus sp. NPDC058071 TaxID=3346326 RepID=UPI0036DA6B5A